MQDQSDSIESKKGPTGPWLSEDARKKHLVGLHLNAKQLAAVEEFRFMIGDDISRPQAIRMIINQWMRNRENRGQKDGVAA